MDSVAAVVAGTVLIIGLFLILTIQSSGQNAAVSVINSVGGQYNSIIGTLMGTQK